MKHTHATKRRASRPGRAVLLTSLLALFIAVPALADHPFTGAGRGACVVGRPVVGRSYFRGSVGERRFAHPPARATGFDAALEYRRGSERGRLRGQLAGYRDGFNGRSFCATAPRDFDRLPGAFVKGYLTAYEAAYAQGFRRGRADCAGPVHHRRHR